MNRSSKKTLVTVLSLVLVAALVAAIIFAVQNAKRNAEFFVTPTERQVIIDGLNELEAQNPATDAERAALYERVNEE